MREGTDVGKRFREAWIAGVMKHYRGKPKPRYVNPWEYMSTWEQLATIAVADQIQQFVQIADTQKLTRKQKSQFVAICWVGQVHKHIPDPPSEYAADWDQLPGWQQEINADVFEAIELTQMRHF